MQTIGRYGATKATTASTEDTITFLPDEIACEGVTEYALRFTTVQYQHITRVRVKVNGNLVHNFSPSYLSAIYRRFGKWDNPTSTATHFAVPFHALTYPDDPSLRALALPPGQATVEVDKNSTPLAGTAGIAWRRVSPAATRSYLSILQEAANVDANQVRELNIAKPGLLRGLVLPELAAGYLNSIMLLWRGVPVIDCAGLDLLGLESMEGGVVQTAPAYIPLREPLPAAECTLRVETGASWSGATNEIGYVLYASY